VARAEQKCGVINLARATGLYSDDMFSRDFLENVLHIANILLYTVRV
jgi:hypothetical protein